MPLFQRRFSIEQRAIPHGTIADWLDRALDGTGITDAARQPLRFTPHDFRRLFITDAVLHGMPPHIAQLISGTATSTLGDLRGIQTLPMQIRPTLTIAARLVIGRQMLQLLARAKVLRRDGPPARGWEPLIDPSSTREGKASNSTW